MWVCKRGQLGILLPPSHVVISTECFPPKHDPVGRGMGRPNTSSAAQNGRTSSTGVLTSSTGVLKAFERPSEHQNQLSRRAGDPAKWKGRLGFFVFPPSSASDDLRCNNVSSHPCPRLSEVAQTQSYEGVPAKCRYYTCVISFQSLRTTATSPKLST